MKQLKDDKRYDVVAVADFATYEKGELIIGVPGKTIKLLGETIKHLLWHSLVEFPKETQEN